MRVSKALAAVGGSGLLVFLAAACGRAPQPAPPEATLPALRIGTGLESLGGLLFIADSHQLFRKEGLAAQLRAYPSGKLALAALLRGEVDVAACASTPVAFAGPEAVGVRVLAVIGTSDNEMKMVARRDHGIEHPADLRGRRVATQQGSTIHIFLHLFLLQQGLLEHDIELSFGPLDGLAGALTSGTCDAAVLREPQVSSVVAGLGTNAVVFSSRGLYVKHYLLVTRSSVLARQPAAIRGAVRALLAAEEFAAREPAAAQETLAGAFAIPPAAVGRLWPDIDLRLSLPQSLLLCLEDEARWAARSGFVTNAPPDFLAMLHTDTLEGLKPHEVTVIH